MMKSMRSHMALATAALMVTHAGVVRSEDDCVDVTMITTKEPQPRSRKRKAKAKAKTLPHQGKKERERRLRQLAKLSQKNGGTK